VPFDSILPRTVAFQCSYPIWLWRYLASCLLCRAENIEPGCTGFESPSPTSSSGHFSCPPCSRPNLTGRGDIRGDFHERFRSRSNFRNAGGLTLLQAISTTGLTSANICNSCNQFLARSRMALIYFSPLWH